MYFKFSFVCVIITYVALTVQFIAPVMSDCDPMDRSTPGLPITNSWSLPKLMSIELVIPSKVALVVLTAPSKTFSKSERILKMEKPS